MIEERLESLRRQLQALVSWVTGIRFIATKSPEESARQRILARGLRSPGMEAPRTTKILSEALQLLKSSLLLCLSKKAAAVRVSDVLLEGVCIPAPCLRGRAYVCLLAAVLLLS